MKKTQAVKIFGETQAELGRAVNLTRARICQWPDTLQQEQIDRVLGAAVRLGVPLPERYYDEQKRAQQRAQRYLTRQLRARR